MTKATLACLMVATLLTGACASGPSQSLTGPTFTTSSTTVTTGSNEVKRYTLSGTVASVIKPLSVLRNARVQVRSGPDDGRFAVSDADGHFALNDVAAGQLLVTISLDGYATWSESVGLYDNLSIEPKLTPLQ